MKKRQVITRLGNPILRQKARHLTKQEILSEEIRNLIADMKETVGTKKYGVGLAAPQVGESIALSVIAIKPTPNRPELEPFDRVIINPEIIETHGYRTQRWEGCISAGKNKDTLFAKVPRYKSVTLKWTDEQGEEHVEKLTSFAAHVAQHEVDHLNGILFVDKVKNPTSYMMSDEYIKRIVKKQVLS